LFLSHWWRFWAFATLPSPFSLEPKVTDLATEMSITQLGFLPIYRQIFDIIRLLSWIQRISGGQSRQRFFSMSVSDNSLGCNLHWISGKLSPESFWKVGRDWFDHEIHGCFFAGKYANTLIVILDTKGKIIGSFTALKYDSSDSLKANNSLKSFLFTPKNPHCSPAVIWECWQDLRTAR
jgi:hypothetical protein